MIKEQITNRLSKQVEFTSCCHCVTFVFDGKEVLQAYQGFFYYSNGVIYSRISEYGDRIEIGKENFYKLLEQYAAA